jgi:predicted site-specific integrase-resolvase
MPDLQELETYLTLQEATDKYEISVEVLTQLVKSGKIKAVRLDGTVAVAEGDVKTEALLRRAEAKASNLRGKKISLSQAAQTYALNKASLWRWAKRGYIQLVTEDGKMLLDEADVVQIRAMADSGRLRKGKALFSGR